MSSDKMNQRVFGAVSRPATEPIALHRLQWLGYVLRTSVQHLLFRVFWAKPDVARR